MRFIFDNTSLRIFFLFFVGVVIFGFFLYTAGETPTMDYTAVDDDNLTPIALVEEDIVLVPETTLMYWEYDWGTAQWEGKGWTATEEVSVTINRIDVNTGNIYGGNAFFGQLSNGYDDMTGALSGAPYIFNALLMILPIGVFFMVLRSFSASW